ncbi:uncharacterized protein HKW66_Vig0088130 [Vigna angularis]|uniref:Transmembrane protein 135 N-terminal domain-containing protein n=1 Tax=Phaseolus angularis TaxID=3914 RepID=A0A8T0KGD2_PHAAN|nr:uncharacterized protein HKW66_Vig0088130 [Vigna angularis]
MSPSSADHGGDHPCSRQEINGFSNDHTEVATPCTASSTLGYIVDAVPANEREKLRRIVVASAKGFSIGAGIKGGLAIFAILARLTRKKPPRKGIVVTNSDAIVEALKETLRYGLFLGTFAGTFVSTDEVIGALAGHRRHALFLSHLNACSILSMTAKWRALVAGAVAGSSMLLTGLEDQHTSLAIYILMRAAVLASRCGIKSKRFGKICKPLTWKHGDIFLMCLSSSQILPSTILTKGLLGTARSSLFLSVYCASAWMWTCFLFRIFKRCNIPMVAMGTFPTGLALAIEKESRRMEISLYCLARAIESFFTCVADAGYLPQSRRIKRADVVVFSLSTAIIMHCYAEEREVFKSKYLNVLDWVFGVPPPPCETPRCKGR